MATKLESLPLALSGQASHNHTEVLEKFGCRRKDFSCEIQLNQISMIQNSTIKNNPKPSKAIKHHRKPSKTIKNQQKNFKKRQKPSKTTKNHHTTVKNRQKPSKTIKKTIKNHQTPSKTIKHHQKPSSTIKHHQKPSKTSQPFQSTTARTSQLLGPSMGFTGTQSFMYLDSWRFHHFYWENHHV